MIIFDWAFGGGDSPKWWQRGHRYVGNVCRAMQWPVMVYVALVWVARC